MSEVTEPEGIKELAKATVGRFVSEHTALWRDMAGEHKAIVEQAANDLAREYFNLLMQPEESKRWQANIAHIKNTLQNVAALVSIKAYGGLVASLRKATYALITAAFNKL